MFGFLLGTACLVGLGAMSRRRRHWRRMAMMGGPGVGCGYPHGHGYGYGYGPGAPFDDGSAAGGPGAWGDPRRGAPWRNRWWRGGLFMMMRRLQLTPDQQALVREELEQLGQVMQEQRAEWGDTRRDVAQAMRDPSFDETVMGEMFGRHDERLTEARKAIMEALGRIHAVLDETQRARLAEMLERSGGRWHPFRGDMA